MLVGLGLWLLFSFSWYTILRLFMFHCYILRLGGGTLGNCTLLIPNAPIYILQAIFFFCLSRVTLNMYHIGRS